MATEVFSRREEEIETYSSPIGFEQKQTVSKSFGNDDLDEIYDREFDFDKTDENSVIESKTEMSEIKKEYFQQLMEKDSLTLDKSNSLNKN